MSNPNEQPKSNDQIDINENGEVVIKDPKLAEALQELTSEELDVIAGGLQAELDCNPGCTNNYTGCGASGPGPAPAPAPAPW